MGQPVICSARSLAVGLAGLSLCGLPLSTLSVSSASPVACLLLGPPSALLLRWEAVLMVGEEFRVGTSAAQSAGWGRALGCIEMKEVPNQSGDKAHPAVAGLSCGLSCAPWASTGPSMSVRWN